MHNPNIFRHSKGELIEITFPGLLEILCFTAYMMLAACTNAQNSPKTGEEKSFRAWAVNDPSECPGSESDNHYSLKTIQGGM